MTKQQRQRHQKKNHTSKLMASRHTPDLGTQTEQPGAVSENQSMPETSDTGGGIGQDSVYEASGQATGGGVDTPLAVERSTQTAVGKQKPLDQGSSADNRGGADNGANL